MNRRRTLALSLLGLVVTAASGAAYVARGEPLTAREAECVGVWSFPRSADPTTTHVYELHADRRAVEHVYYESHTKRTGEPRMMMEGGVWSIDADDRLTVEPAGGLRGLGTELRRRVRETAGNSRYDHRLLTRFYMIEAVAPDRLVVTCSKSGEGGTETLGWTRLKP